MLDITASPDVMRDAVFKGSMAVDGISLTVASVTRKASAFGSTVHTDEVIRLAYVGSATR